MMELSIEPWLCASETRPEASKTGKKAKKSVQKQVDFCEKSGKIGGGPRTHGHTDGQRPAGGKRAALHAGNFQPVEVRSAPPLQYRHHNAAGFGTQRRRISRSLSKTGVGFSRTRRDSPAPPERTLPEGVRGSFPKKNIARGGKRPACGRPEAGRPRSGRPSASRRPADGRTAESNSILF